jgi:L-ascorbate metabolism protein UlaG (beta-lactamase superfamily)
VARVKVKFVGHSGFLLETGGRFLLFDLYKDEANVLSHGLPFEGAGAIFVSHSHGDHFNPKVFGLGVAGRTSFIVDEGVRAPKTDCELFRVSPGRNADLGWAEVKAFGSTDEGCSFLVDVGGIRIFHAGDLNDWYWEDESTKEELQNDEARFMQELGKIVGNEVDIAFFPVDMRLGRHALRGAIRFAEAIRPKFLLPMHVNGRLDADLLPKALLEKGIRAASIYMANPGEEVLIEP